MHDNPAADRQWLMEHYRAISDEELEELSADFKDLTPTAQEVLRGELSTRGLPAPGTTPVVSKRGESDAPQNWASNVDPEAGVSRSRSFDESEKEAEDGGSTEFTWKTLLCECESTDQAAQLQEALKRAGIDSWIERPGTRWAVFKPRIQVAEDQLEQAIEIARQPIPRDILDQTREEIPEYEPPKCPSCGAEDPVLESAEPTNSWLCEACGKQWTEPQLAGEEQTGEARK